MMNAITIASRAHDKAMLALQALALVKDVIEANDQRRDEILESLTRALCKHSLIIGHKRRICYDSYDLYRDLESMLSMDGLPDDLRADLESKMAEAKERLSKVQDEIEEEERKLNELVKSLDELKAPN